MMGETDIEGDVGGAIQDGQVMVESSDKTCSTGEGNGQSLHHSWLEKPMNSMKGKKI